MWFCNHASNNQTDYKTNETKNNMKRKWMERKWHPKSEERVVDHFYPVPAQRLAKLVGEDNSSSQG